MISSQSAENRKKVSRGLEKVYHYFLTSETPSDFKQKSEEKEIKLEDEATNRLSNESAKYKESEKIVAKAKARKTITAKENLSRNKGKVGKNHYSEGSVSINYSVYDGVENTIAKLYVLRDSCKGIFYLRKPDNNLNWFQGAAAILQDAILNLNKAFYSIKKVETHRAVSDSDDSHDDSEIIE